MSVLKNIPIVVEQPVNFKTSKVMRKIQEVPENMLPVMEVFKTIEGEGTFVGVPRVLARVAGCGVGCSWCDTPHSWSMTPYPLVSVEDFVRTIVEKAGNQVKEVSITGGEPMHYPVQMMYVSRRLKSLGYKTSIETSGIIISEEVFNQFDYVSLDVKTPSAHVPMEAGLLDKLVHVVLHHQGAQLKAVVEDEEDLAWIEANLMDVLRPRNPGLRPLVITPCADNTKKAVPIEDLNDTIDMVLEWNKGYNIRVLAQQHKLVFRDPPFVHPKKR
jgi:organic radical activating enzyme